MENTGNANNFSLSDGFRVIGVAMNPNGIVKFDVEGPRSNGSGTFTQSGELDESETHIQCSGGRKFSI